ncbi:hypothetical protein OSB04_un000092 [Centaurea solstitialis]|uniref:Reverse transcriptase zinc-binding domain-containing protein n=1 Tax=Centaurea solstitialis TaxID=347529 RepID=A0AA38VS85_9ASTR|nr:hypothetical protein OSB04_un000092 [Centaurea solstitialis]
MSVFLIPSSVIHTIEQLFRNFLWANSDSAKGKVRVAWEDVCKPKVAGGLGLKRMAVWNRALMTSHVWDVLRRKKSLWVSWIHHHRLSNVHFWNAPLISNSSWIWRKLLELREQVRPFFIFSVGDGLEINAWEDKWLMKGSISSWLPFRYFGALGFTKHSTVSDVLLSLNSVWPQAWITRVPSLLDEVCPTLRPNERDSLLWVDLQHNQRRFSVSEVWKSFLGNLQIMPWHDLCWFKGNIPKHSFCLWLAIQDRLPTQDRMRRWLPDDSNLLCSLCNQQMDSRDHLFFQCNYSNMVWNAVRSWIGSVQIGSWSLILHELSNRQWHPGDMKKKLFFVAAVYYIWQERNHRLFRGKKRDEEHLIRDLKTYIQTRSGGRDEVTNVAGPSTWQQIV